MSLARSINYDMANEILSAINQEVVQSAANNLNSLPIHLEDTYCLLLNCLLGLKLVNANKNKKNISGIDLIDDEARVCIQVTADASSEKMKHTLSRPIMERLAKDGYTLKFCYVGEQKKCAKTRKPTNPYGIKFAASEDVILTSDILGSFMHLTLKDQEAALSILKRETEAGYILTEEWIEESVCRAIKRLGPRYTPKANVETPTMRMFSGLSRGYQFRKEITDLCAKTSSELENLAKLSEQESDFDKRKEITEYFSDFVTYLAAIPGSECRDSDFEEWVIALDVKAQKILPYPDKWISPSWFSEKMIDALRDVRYRVRQIINFAYSSGVWLLSSKRVLICGEAGMGKSHLLADLCEKVLADGNAAILLLGEQFYGPSASEESIPSILGLPGTVDDLLKELQRYATVRDGVSFLVIDALNEGEGRSFWRYSLPDLLEKAKKYPDLRIVLSVRSTYEHDVVASCLNEGEDFQRIECSGFGDASDTAVKMLCEYYGIEAPLTPLIGMEFSNPLYLNLLCRYAKTTQKSFAKDVEMRDLVLYLLDDVNARLSDFHVLGFDQNVPLVRTVVKAIVEDPEYVFGFIQYEKASDVAISIARDYINPPGAFLDYLVSEGLFNVVGDRDDKHLVFSYELVGNFASAFALTSRAKDLYASGALSSCQEALESLLRQDWAWVIGDMGVFGALSTIVPAECGCEVFDLNVSGCKHCGDLYEIEYAFIEGLPWRNIEVVTSEMNEFVKKHILSNNYLRDDFFSTCFQLALRRSGINADYICDLLLPMCMSYRDYLWSSTIAHSQKAETFVDWMWANGGRLTDEDACLAAKMLVLCLSVTNPPLRRKAIKALAVTLIGRPLLASLLWDSFCGIDDDYILEGLCGAVYGALVNSENIQEWKPLAHTIHTSIVESEEAHPNAIVRDYVLSIYGLFFDVFPDAASCFEAFSSGFKSVWYETLPSNEEIDEIMKKYEDRYGKESDECFSVWWLIHSMTTEYGRGTCAYGDFGRYTLGYMVSPWRNQFESDQLLSNALIKHILAEWYAPKLHASYDVKIKRMETHGLANCERIGKKYQKIALNRLIARLLDNYPPVHTRKVHKPGYEEYCQECIDSLIKGYSGGNTPKVDIEENDWVLREESVACDCVEVGNDFLRLRSEDPSFPWNPSTLKSPCDFHDIYPSIVKITGNSHDWCQREDDFYKVNYYRKVTIGDISYYTLAIYANWKTLYQDRRYREATWMSCGYLVSSENAKTVFGSISNPCVGKNYSYVRLGELFDGMGYHFSCALDYSERSDLDKKISESCYQYDWEQDLLELGERTSILLPCKSLVDYFQLRRRGAFEWISENGEILSMCIKDRNSGNYALLFKADRLEHFLIKTNQTIIWDEYFEKLTASRIYRKWTNTIPQDDSYESCDSDEPYCGEFARNHSLLLEDEWIDI